MNLKQRLKLFTYTFKHKIAFLIIEYKLTGKITLSGLLHDSDKLYYYLISNKSKKEIQNIHRSRNKHHVNDMGKTHKDYVEMVIDWECARYTKPDKQLNARETLYQFYPELISIIEPILIKLGL